ncbi:MAG: GNAT family N-acetyltransferase [Syntrophaceae bacterium]|nr:GNAT family N-acetyltransferase [Syntrophaceae bacterium]
MRKIRPMDIVLPIKKTVPDRLLTVRPMRRTDAAMVASWIEEGRRTGVFRPGSGPTSASLLHYQNEMSQRVCDYELMIAESNGEAIGYIDYSVNNNTGEVIGLFIVPAWRNRRVGLHLLRCVLAILRDKGCHAVQVEVFESNKPSKKLLRRAGFYLDSKINRAEDPKRVLVFKSLLAPFERLGDLEPGYGLLKGENIYIQHMALAEAFVSCIRDLPGLEMVLGLGSLSRGFADQWSDLDIAILARGSVVDSFWRGELWFMGVSIDLFVVDIDSCPPCNWDASRKQAFQESIVLFTNSRQQIRNLRSVLHQGIEERRDTATELLFRIGWLGYMPRSWFMKERFGYIWALPPDEWIHRGSVAAAHITIDQVFEMELALLFVANNRRIPDPKWRRFLAPSLPWLPSKFDQNIKILELTNRNRSAFDQRSCALLDMIDATVEYLEKQDILRGNLYRRFLRKFSDYDPRR